MTLSEISTEILFKLRDRFHSGRIRFSAVAQDQAPDVIAWLRECQRKMIEAIENELRRRLN
jgi:hypothetical protein